MANTDEREGMFLLEDVRLSFPKLTKAEKPKGAPDGSPRFGVVVMIPKDTKKGQKQHADLDAYIDQLKAKPPLKGTKVKADAICLKDGDDDDEDENYRGYWVLSANRAEKQKRPGVADRRGKPLTDVEEIDDLFYGGAWANVYIGLFVPKEWKKVCASLEALQFVKHDTPFGNRTDVKDIFKDLGDDAEEEEEEEEDFKV